MRYAIVKTGVLGPDGKQGIWWNTFWRAVVGRKQIYEGYKVI